MTGKKFIIKNTRWDDTRRKLYFHFVIETDQKNFEIQESLEFPDSIPVSHEEKSLVRALHIALSTSYYKAFLTPEIEHPYDMADRETVFWNTVFKNGLGEFLFKNKISTDRLAKFRAQSGFKISSTEKISWKESCLLGIGGGKDSIVAGEILKKTDLDVTGFVMATGELEGQSRSVATVMGIDLLSIKRKIDPQILEINKIDGTYNGHIPISLIFGLVGALTATINSDKYVVVANEASASIPQTESNGVKINHQWSKSLEFERLFQDYLHEYVSPDLEYFSAIRPLNSVLVAKIFSKHPKYFEVFTSDNSLFRIKQTARQHPRWSVDSPKTLSSFILLAPWMNDEDLIRTFGDNYLDKIELINLFKGLLGANNDAILDCVGTPDELRYSLNLLVEQSRFLNSALIQAAKDENLLASGGKVSTELDNNHSMPEELSNEILATMKENLK